MTGISGSHRSLLDEKHATGCDGREFTKAQVAPYGPGFVIVRMEWCGECGAVDWEYIDKMLPDEADIARWSA